MYMNIPALLFSLCTPSHFLTVTSFITIAFNSVDPLQFPPPLPTFHLPSLEPLIMIYYSSNCYYTLAGILLDYCIFLKDNSSVSIIMFSGSLIFQISTAQHQASRSG